MIYRIIIVVWRKHWYRFRSLAKRREDPMLPNAIITKDFSVPDFGGFEKCHNTGQQVYLFFGTIHQEKCIFLLFLAKKEERHKIIVT